MNKTGTGFKGTVLYLLYGRLDALNLDRVEWIESRNLPTRNAMAAVRIMAATARDSGSRQAPVYHISISFDPDDPVDRAIMIQVADRLLRDLDLEEHQALIVSHKDRLHPHLHLVVNRVHPERLTVWSNWYDFPRIERSLRAQEVELGLRVVPGHLALVPHSAELRPQPRLKRGDAAFLREVQERAGPVLQRAQSWAEVERDLAAFGLRVRVNGRGMSVTDGQQEVKASEVDRAFSRSKMEKRLGSFGEYRALHTLREGVAPPPPAEPAFQMDEAGDDAPRPTVPDSSPPPAPVEPQAWAQLSLAFPEPARAVASQPSVIEPPAIEPVGSTQLTLALEESLRPVSSPRHRAEPTSLTLPEVTPVERVRPIQLPYLPVEPAASREQAGADRGLVSPPASEPPGSPIPAEQPLVTERPGAWSGKEIPPWLGRVRQLIRESLDCNQAIAAANDARDAEDAPAQELKRLQELERTALADAKRLQEALASMYFDSLKAALELTQFGLANGWMTTRYALRQTPERFGALRTTRFWYTIGPGRKDVQSVLDPLEKAMRSEGERPTQVELTVAQAHLDDAVRIHIAARDALYTFRAPQTCEKEAARLLQPPLGEFSAAEIAQLLAELLPPEDREGAKLVQRIVDLAISLNQMLSRKQYRGWE
ncbi:MAG TPA: relaxase/mobilization nuclease domain-containing protein [Longimicrobium sp.]|nr:relaxase/mobilization nuclease domain-containing protein [Longimicrobium sp.]